MQESVSFLYADNGDDWTAWKAYAPTMQFTLREGLGYRGVYVHARDAAGNESNMFYRRTTVIAQEEAPAPQPAPARVVEVDGSTGGADWVPIDGLADLPQTWMIGMALPHVRVDAGG